MARNEQLIRQHKILQILERVRLGRTLNELKDDITEELGLSSLHTRTLRRDLMALQAAGIDVDVHDERRGKVWKLGPRHKSSHRISATATELLALYLGRELLTPLAGTHFWMGIESFWHKIREELPPAVIKMYDKQARELHVLGVPSKSYQKHQGIIKTLNRAIQEHRVVEVVYQSVGNPSRKRLIEPYTMILNQSSLYIIAGAVEVEDPAERTRSFKLDRFEKATILDKWFKVPKDLDLDEFIGTIMNMFVSTKPKNFRIHIKPNAAQWVEEDPWHPDQKVKKFKDGSIELSIKAGNEMAIIPRVLHLGANAEIISPASARKQMRQIAKELTKIYKE